MLSRTNFATSRSILTCVSSLNEWVWLIVNPPNLNTPICLNLHFRQLFLPPTFPTIQYTILCTELATTPIATPSWGQRPWMWQRVPRKQSSTSRNIANCVFACTQDRSPTSLPSDKPATCSKQYIPYGVHHLWCIHRCVNPWVTPI